MDRPDGTQIDVAVVAYNSNDMLPGLYRSVCRLLPPGSRLAIWANSDPKPIQAWALAEAENASNYPIIVSGDGTNLGFGTACNKLAQWSDRDFLLFLNPDAVLESMPRNALAESEYMWAPIVKNEDGEIQQTFGGARTLWDEIQLRILRRPARGFRAAVQAGGAVEFASGACFWITRDGFLELNGFDERFFMYYEDIDLGRRWHGMARTTLVHPDFVVRHIGAASASSNREEALRRSFLAARAYHYKWSRCPQMFRMICLLEAVAKLLVAVATGRVGQIDRPTQAAYTRWLFSSLPTGASTSSG